MGALVRGGGAPGLREPRLRALLPRRPLPALLADPDPAKARRTMEAMLTMVKLDITALRRAHDGA